MFQLTSILTSILTKYTACVLKSVSMSYEVHKSTQKQHQKQKKDSVTFFRKIVTMKFRTKFRIAHKIGEVCEMKVDIKINLRRALVKFTEEQNNMNQFTENITHPCMACKLQTIRD